jgi:FtsP/CotA-like multicopper oxidase with cupredoxin domain
MENAMKRAQTARHAIAGVVGVATVAGAGVEVIGQVLDPTVVPKYVETLVIPPAMPRTGAITGPMGERIEYYEIAVRQFSQFILPAAMGLAPTTVWSYGSVTYPATFNYPAFTIEAKVDRPLRVKWINDLKDPKTGMWLPHIVPVDQTLHWANPPGGLAGRDHHGHDQAPYTGPVPIVTHVHGAHTFEDSDGFAEAWYVPAGPIPMGYAAVGTWYDAFNQTFQARYGAPAWEPGTATFQYPNNQKATTLWYHDHTLGMTRANVYAGPAGFYILRGGPSDMVLDTRNGRPAVLPGPAPAMGDPPGLTYYEIPIAIQDRSFKTDGSLFYPDNRAFFEGLNVPPTEPYLDIPFRPDPACEGRMSDVSPIWNPEFFGNTIVVNGKTWPYLDVGQRRYRFRFLNGCNSRFLILRLSNGRPFWQIGAEGGFLAEPAMLSELLIAPAERADVIVDFGGLHPGTLVMLQNVAPDEPFGGGVPGEDFDPADPDTTGQVMLFRVVRTPGKDKTTPPQFLGLPTVPTPGPALVRQLSLNEESSRSVRVIEDENGNIVLACDDPEAEPFGPVEADLGILNPDGTTVRLGWDEPMTEMPKRGTTETWEFYNFTADAHPIHIHLVQFQVVGRQQLETDEEGMATQPAMLIPGTERPPEAWETGFKDTVVAFPGEVTRVQARFDLAGLYVWHCHIVEHEDNEMMRPYRVLP